MKRTKIFISVIMSVICVCALIFGVYSVKNATLTANGVINFNATEMQVGIDASISGAVESDYTEKSISYKATNSGAYGYTYTDLCTPCNLGAMYFNDMIATSYSEVEDIVITFKVINYSSYSGYAYFAQDGNFIDYLSIASGTVEIFFSSRSYIAAANVANAYDEIEMTVRVALSNWELISNVNLNFTLCIAKYIPTTAGLIISSHTLTGFVKDEIPSLVFLPDSGTNSISTLGNDAFFNNGTGENSGVTAIVIPTTVTELGNALYMLPLTSFTIPKSVTRINDKIINYNMFIKYLIIPSSVEYIQSSIYERETQLKRVVISIQEGKKWYYDAYNALPGDEYPHLYSYVAFDSSAYYTGSDFYNQLSNFINMSSSQLYQSTTPGYTLLA